MASEKSDILMRLVINNHNVQKLKLQNVSCLDNLRTIIAKKANIDYEFVLQYFDEDFNDYFNLDQLDNLTHMGTIKVVKAIVEKEASKDANSEPSSTQSNPWPQVFPLPNFSDSIFIKTHMECLAAEYSKDGHVLVPEVLRRKIVSSLVEQIVKYTYYPLGKDIENMCRTLIEKFPFLKDSGPGGCSTWSTCVKFKVGNLRKSLKKSVPEIACNSGKRSKENPLAPSPHSSIKKQRTGIIMVPRSSLKSSDVDESKKHIASELKKHCPDFKLVKELMGKTWPARWRYIQENPPITDIFKEWPAYEQEQFVFMDFARLTNVSLEETFFPVFDDLVPKILSLGSNRMELKAKCSSVPDTIEMRRETALDAMRVLLGEKECSPLIKVSKDEDTDSVCEVKDCTIVKTYGTFGIVMEKTLIAKDISSSLKAVCLIFAYIWVLNVQYPKDNKHVWEFLEKVVLKIGSGSMSAKLVRFQQKLNLQ